MKEEWKEAPGTKGRYSISNYGRIKSHFYKDKIIKGSNCNGYRVIDVDRRKNRKILYVHRLVAEAFIPNPENKPCINHKDGDKLNNHVSNIEWCTHQENTDHAIETGLYNHRGERHTDSVLSRKDVLEIRAAYNLGCFSYHDFSDAYGTTVDNIRHLIKRRSWTHI